MLTTGHHVSAFALTEPNAGSDASKGQTEAKPGRATTMWMNGTKIFITNGYYADTYVVFARHNPDLSVGHKGLSAFIVEKGWKGF